jgi:hypothetical protein
MSLLLASGSAAPVVAPPTQNDFPNPRVAQRGQYDVGAIALALFVTVAAALPFNNSSQHTNPTLSARGQFDVGQGSFKPLLTSVMPAATGWGNLTYAQSRAAFEAGENAVLPTPTVVTASPFAQSNWPNPVAPPRSQFDTGQGAFRPLLTSVMPAATGWGNLTYSFSRAAFEAGSNAVLPTPTVITPLPPGNTDWSIPRGVRSQYEPGQSAFRPLLTSVMPSTTGWGNLSYVASRAMFDAGSNAVLPTPTVVVIPTVYAQTDWPNPILPIRSQFDAGTNAFLPTPKRLPVADFGGHDLPVKRVKDRKWKEKEERQALRALIEFQFEMPAVRQAIAPYMREVGNRAKPNWAQIYEHAAQIEQAIAQIQQNIDNDDEDILSLI